MSSRESCRMIALRVRCGDLVRVWGRWLEVTAVRDDRFAAGGPAVVLTFDEGPAMRVHAADELAVER
ncbi:hypothetical protein [Streptomyces beijiangensis]|uniref:Uncharacterized protein n=1 Tax=Streptomyces beijiangensis TaxID=163361 RepID=A0A939F533_9ACTN|nr:hypothetical protein [Streptomyces beijiangensis]MBO0511634.1 hypothetical protein [Streptomyces beijiangensis]